MKKILFLLLFTFSISSFVGCSKDDEMSQKELTSKMAEYAEVLDSIAKSEAKIKVLQEEAKGLSGGRWTIKQEEITKEIEVLQKLRDKKKKLAQELGIQ